MRRLALAVALISSLASAQSLQTPGVPSCNQWGFCPPFAAQFVDAGEATIGIVEADHVGGTTGTPTCVLDAGFTACAPHGNDLEGTVVLTGSPSSTAGTLLFSLRPSVSFDGGFNCMISPANADAGVAYAYLMVNTNNGSCNVGLGATITIGWPSATGSAFNYVFGGH